MTAHTATFTVRTHGKGTTEITRDELLLATGAAKQKAGRNAHRLVILHLPASKEQVTAATKANISYAAT